MARGESPLSIVWPLVAPERPPSPSFFLHHNLRLPQKNDAREIFEMNTADLSSALENLSKEEIENIKNVLQRDKVRF